MIPNAPGVARGRCERGEQNLGLKVDLLFDFPFQAREVIAALTGVGIISERAITQRRMAGPKPL